MPFYRAFKEIPGHQLKFVMISRVRHIFEALAQGTCFFPRHKLANKIEKKAQTRKVPLFKAKHSGLEDALPNNFSTAQPDGGKISLSNTCTLQVWIASPCSGHMMLF